MRSPQRMSSRRGGMTLIEVIVAIAVFMIALAGIAQLVEFGSNNAIDAARTATGNRLAQSKMAEVEAGVVAVSESSSGTFDEEPLWQWSVEVGAPVALNIYPVTVRVWIEQGRPIEVRTSQIIYDPLFMSGAAAAVAPTTTTQGP
jgi:general secretion pathway protein I